MINLFKTRNSLGVVLTLLLVKANAQTYNISLSKEYKQQENKVKITDNYLGGNAQRYYIETQHSISKNSTKYYLKHFDDQHNLMSESEIPDNSSNKESGNYLLSKKMIDGIFLEFRLAYDKKTKVSEYYVEDVLTKSRKELGKVDNINNSDGMEIIEDTSEGTFSACVYSLNKGKLSCTYSTYSSSLKELERYEFELPVAAGKKINIFSIKRVGDKIALVVKLTNEVQSKEDALGNRFDLATYVYDMVDKTIEVFESKTKNIEVINSSAGTNSIQVKTHGTDLCIVFQLIQNKSFYGIGYYRLNLDDMSLDEDKTILFGENDKARVISANPKYKNYSDNLELHDVYIKSNGNALLVFESKTARTYSSTGPNIEYGNVVIFEITTEAKFKSIDLIEKIQADNWYASFASTLLNDELYIFMNDYKEKYTGNAKKLKSEVLQYGNEGVCVAFKLGKDGKLTWKKISDTYLKNEMEMNIRDARVLSSDKLLFLMHNDDMNQQQIITIAP